MTADPFRPFETNLDRDTALALLQEATRGADDGELFLERKRSEVLSFDDGKVKTASFDASEGFGLRAVKGETAGYAHSTTIDEHALKASLAASHQEVLILRPDGHLVTDTRPMTRFFVSVIVEENGQRESGSAGGGGRAGLIGLMSRDNWERDVREALRIALVNLAAEPAPAGVMDVVLGPGWPGILLHEAIGHGLEGDFNRKGSSAFAGLMGQQIAAKGVTVLDDGTIPDRRGSITVDDEGTPSAKGLL